MAKATESQIKELERKHKTQFADLVAAIDFFHKSKNYSNITPAARAKYGQSLLPLIAKWDKRQNKLESRGGSTAKIMQDYFPRWYWFMEDKYQALVAKRDQMNAEKKASGTQMGFIPLIIWAVIAIVAAFTAEEIIDETNDTAEEQATLVAETNTFCKDNNLTPAQCQQMLTEQNAAATSDDGGMFGGILKPLAWGAAIFFGVKYGLPLLNGNGKKSS